MESNNRSTHVQGSIAVLSTDVLLDRPERHSAVLQVDLCVSLLVVFVVQYTIVMPYVDGRMPSAIEEMRPGVGQIRLPCIVPVQPTSPRYRCAELLVLYSGLQTFVQKLD